MSRIPVSARLAVMHRDKLRCQRCFARGTDWHHRRSRRIADKHQHCPCNGVLLCRTCHTWAHSAARNVAVERGFIVSSYVATPGIMPMMTASGVWTELLCNGTTQAIMRVHD